MGGAAVVIVSYDPESSVAPFEQVRAQLAAAIEAGSVRPGQRLPSIRVLAADLGLAVNTVARAFRELEVAGLVTSHGPRGTFVGSAPRDDPAEATAAVRVFADRMRTLGVSRSEMLSLLRRELDADRRASRFGRA